MLKRGLLVNEKRGQVTIFIIIAVIIVALVALVFLFKPDFIPDFDDAPKSPDSFIESCLEEKIQETVETLSLQGGSINPEFYILYKNNKAEYLCYTNEYYKNCILQQPMLKKHIEEEIKNNIKNDVRNCFNSLKKSYEEKGYVVGLQTGETRIELIPKRIVSTFNYVVTLTKDSVDEYNSFDIVLNNNLYELVGITNSILDWEATYGDAEPTIYMDYYRDLKVEKFIDSDGSTIYTLTDKNTNSKFVFASRSLVWPPGIVIQE